MSYWDLYKKRVGRTETSDTHQARLDKLNAAREKNFENFLFSSPHYVKFDFVNKEGETKIVEGVLEPFRQNETRNMMQLLCRVGEKFSPGDIAKIEDREYMFYYWDARRDSGYNRWTLMEMSHIISWTGADKKLYSSSAYMYFQEDNMLKNELRSRSRSATLYLENLKLNFLLMPFNDKLEQETYLEITTMGIKQSFRVTGIDIVSNPGVMWVSMDPTLERDLSPMPEPTADDDADDFFWGGGDINDRIK